MRRRGRGAEEEVVHAQDPRSAERLKHELRRSHREIVRSLGIANSTVSAYVGRASAAGFSWPLPEGMDDAGLEAALSPGPRPSWVRRRSRTGTASTGTAGTVNILTFTSRLHSRTGEPEMDPLRVGRVPPTIQW